MFEIKEIFKINGEKLEEAFYRSILIYINKAQVINRKVNTTNNLITARIKGKSDKIVDILRKNSIVPQFVDKLEEILHKNEIDLIKVKLEDEIQHVDEKYDGDILNFNKIIPRNVNKHNSCYQLAIFNLKTHTISFYGICDDSKILPPVDYAIQYENNKLKLFIETVDVEKNETNWLQFVLLKKMMNWMESFNEDDDQSQRIESHSLINDEEYSIMYANLKDKYGKKFESIWSEEVTDPKKYIYEDISIAAYLLSFWKKQRLMRNIESKQSFIDFGCGNGLLVAILSMEGHKGYGMDIRKRKIWKKFGTEVDLREITWTPSDSLDETDWIIGNHSDELSPWVPVVAARNNITCNYFLLPCCAYEFSGAKFQRKGSAKSLYMSFIDYLTEISSVCGFQDTLIDRLKIPSTKRICLIGMDRLYGENEVQEYTKKIENFISLSKNLFLPREKEQAVRNCTKIDKNLTERIVRTIFEALLSEQKYSENNWNMGTEINLSDAVKLIPSEDLKLLKSEHGGLQTLLRNKHQIFEVYSGKLKIRKPKRINERSFVKKKISIKSSPCYFHLYHKQGCLLKDEECCFRH